MNNNQLRENLARFTGTENYHRNFFGILYTDGVQYLANEAECYWLIDLVASYQHDSRVKNHHFQAYELKVFKDCSAMVTIMDWDSKVLARQRIDFTDFPLDTITLWFENNVLFLPSEY